MDACSFLLFFMLGIVILAVLGHGIWMAGAAIGQALFGSTPPADRRQLRDECPRCGRPVSARHCFGCGLDLDGPLANQLYDINITWGTIQALVDQGELTSEVGNHVLDSLEARNESLRRRESRPRTAGADTGAAPAWQGLNRLLGTVRDLRELSTAQRQQALAW